ncbi:MAG: hypothetical protein ABSG92_03735 [Conexivisphaerales archaeon]
MGEPGRVGVADGFIEVKEDDGVDGGVRGPVSGCGMGLLGTEI